MALTPTSPPAAPISVSTVRTGKAGDTTINPDGFTGLSGGRGYCSACAS